jgi:hypothetical protein
MEDVIESFAVSVEDNSRDIFGEKKKWALCFEESYVLEEELSSMVLDSSQHSCFAPTLARRTANHPVAGWYVVRLDGDDTPRI